ncbi:uncharacterized protein LOC100678745 [Nasonia vitripennis]|uniref:Disks large-associated protein 5 n=1 Tax=Nasonia vitripennis TaxID=7425 RepID=A0A7M7GEZ4_NASVI|nr:uncharacterized protein LOC100678745 [Nasonia vitripennis]
MTDFRERYKRVGIGREDMAANRALRSQRRDEARRDARTEHFSMRRDMEEDVQDDEDDNVAREEAKQNDERLNSVEESKKKADEDLERGVKQRLLELEKWREERNRRRLQEKKRAKPAFKVGVVHHRVYSPPLTKDPVPPPPAKLCKSKEIHHHNPEPPPKRVTRATEKRLAVKAVSSKQKREDLRTKKKDKEKVQPKIKNSEEEQVPLAPDNFQFKAPLGITAIPMFGRQALDATKNNENVSNPSDVSSSISEFGKGLSDASDSVFHTKNHSIILSKSSSRRSNSSASNLYSCDSSIAKSYNNSLNESSVEAVTLKLSMDDQEMLDDKESTSRINSTVTDDKKSKRRSRIVTPPEAAISACEDQEMKEFESDVTFSKSNTKSPAIRRSSRTITEKSKSIETPPKSASFTVQDHEMEDQANSQTFKSISFTANTSSTRQKKTKSPGRRRTTRAFARTQGNESNQNVDTVEEMDTDTLDVEKMNESNETKTSHNDSASSEQKIQIENRRRSTKIVPEEITNARDSSFLLEDQEMLEDQENIDYNAKNLIDYSISDLSKVLSPKRKSMRFAEDLQDQSLMKFSPRHSMRPQMVNSPKQSSMFTAMLTNEGPKEIAGQSIKKLPTPKTDITTHNTSEPTNQIIFEKNDTLNQSLNMSLPKGSTPDKPPAFFSPYVVASRGKDRVRKEVQRRRFSQPLPVEIPTKETVMQTLNISVEEEERTAQYYKFILDKEIERLNEICDTWNVIKDDPTTPEDIHYEIQAAVGQTQLLVNKKFERFRGLVLDCETGKGEMLVTCKDLQGFWEMMYMEIKDCDNRFNRLEGKKAKNWVIEETEEEKKDKIPKKKPVAAKKPAAKKKPVPAKSSLRAHIMAARKKKMESKDNDIDIEMKEAPAVLPEIVEEAAKDASTPHKNIRRSTSTPKSTNKWQSLLKKVQLSQTRKSTTSPLIVMKLSQMCKTPEVQLDDSIVYINSDRTPAKSILKSAKEELMGAVAKSANKVFFKEQPTEFREFESNIESNNEEMNLDNPEEFKEPIERRLDFENDSFNHSNLEEEDMKDQEEAEKPADSLITSPLNTTPKDQFIKIPRIVVTESSPFIPISHLSLQDKKEQSPVKKNARTKKTISFKVDESNESSTRSLRTRKLSAPGTPRPKSRNSKVIDDEYVNMDVDNSCLDSFEDFPASPPQQSKQLYMNAEGIICEKIISVQKDTPRTSTLKRANSEAIRRSTRSNKIKNSEAETPSTPKHKRRNFIEVVIDSPTTPVNTDMSKSRKSSSSLRLKSPKPSEVDTTLTEGDANTTVREEGTPKSSKKTPKTRRTLKTNSLDLDENVQETATIKLKRSKSLNATKVNALSNESVKESETPRTRRTTSRLDKSKPTVEDSKIEVLTPSLKRKHSKRLQENVESDEQQETDEDVIDRIKVSRTPSIKRRNSKKYLDSVENCEQQIDKNSKNEILTPNTRRKSLRISKSIHEK